MSIVRSLLISIGFKTDKKAINETNRAITGFKTRFAIAATAASYAFKVIKDFFTDIAAATLDSEELARSLGISLNELTAMQQAAQKFRIKPEQFSGVLSMLQKDLNEFVQGFGRLPELARQIGIEIARDTTPIQLFDKIIEKIREIEDEQQRIRIASAIFGEQLGVRISDLSQNFDGFKESVKDAYEELQKLPDITPEAKAYEQAVNGMGQAFDRLVRQLGTYVFPALEKLFNYLEYVSKFYGTLFSGDFAGFKEVLDIGSKKIDEIAQSFSDKVTAAIDYLNPYVTYDPTAPRTPAPESYGPSWIESQLPASWVSYVNNQVDMNVPSGTSAEQTAYLGDQVQRMIEDSILDTFYQIQNNNPQVE
jgi:hypothetical protein